MLNARHLILPALSIGVVFGAHAIRPANLDEPAAAAQLEELTREIAACPELASLANESLLRDEGILSAKSADLLAQEAEHCRKQRKHIAQADRYRLAYSAFKAMIASNTGSSLAANTLSISADQPERITLEPMI